MSCRVKIVKTLTGYIDLAVDDENKAIALANELFNVQGKELPDMDDSSPLKFEFEPRKHYYRIWVMPRHSDDYPVYLESNSALTDREAMDRAAKECYLFTLEDAKDLTEVEEISEQEWAQRMEPDKYLSEVE